MNTYGFLWLFWSFILLIVIYVKLVFSRHWEPCLAHEKQAQNANATTNINSSKHLNWSHLILVATSLHPSQGHLYLQTPKDLLTSLPVAWTK